MIFFESQVNNKTILTIKIDVNNVIKRDSGDNGINVYFSSGICDNEIIII